MPTNGMTIDSLNTVSSLTAQDEVPVWDKEASSEPTKKITGSNLASSVKTLGSLLDTSNVVNNLTSNLTNQPLSAAQGKVLNDNFGGAQMVLVEITVTLPDGRSSATTTTVDLSSYIPAGKSIRAISSVHVGNYPLPYIVDGNVLTYVGRVFDGKKIDFINKSSVWPAYPARLVLFCS